MNVIERSGRDSPSVMPADAAGQVLPKGLPRALPGVRDPTALAAAPRAGDITRPGPAHVHLRINHDGR
jgi:hypothetical protein